MKEVQKEFQGSFKGVSRKFQGCFKEVSRLFHESFRGVSRKFKAVSRNIEGCLILVLSGFQVYMKEVQRVFQERFKVMYQENFKKAFKGVLNVLYCNFVVAWHLSQLPEQKEGLFIRDLTKSTKPNLLNQIYQT